MPLSRNEVNSILAEEKVIGANLYWKRLPIRRGRRYRLEAKVLVPRTGVLLTLTGTVGKSNFSFVLLYANYPIVKMTKHHSHHNPDCNDVTGLHIHIWDDMHEDGIAERLGNGRSDDMDTNAALMQFLQRCNIRLIGAYEQILL